MCRCFSFFRQRCHAFDSRTSAAFLVKDPGSCLEFNCSEGKARKQGVRPACRWATPPLKLCGVDLVGGCVTSIAMSSCLTQSSFGPASNCLTKISGSCLSSLFSCWTVSGVGQHFLRCLEGPCVAAVYRLSVRPWQHSTDVAGSSPPALRSRSCHLGPPKNPFTQANVSLQA